MLPILGHIPECPVLGGPTCPQAASPGQCLLGGSMGNTALCKDQTDPSQLYRGGNRVTMMPGNQNKSNSQLLPVAESSAVSGTEEMIACLSRDCFPSCVGTTTGKQVNSHKHRRETAQRPHVGKVTAPEAFQSQRWVFIPAGLSLGFALFSPRAVLHRFLMLHLVSRAKWYFPYLSLILRPPFRERIIHPFPLPTPTRILCLKPGSDWCCPLLHSQ